MHQFACKRDTLSATNATCMIRSRNDAVCRRSMKVLVLQTTPQMVDAQVRFFHHFALLSSDRRPTKKKCKRNITCQECDSCSWRASEMFRVRTALAYCLRSAWAPGSFNECVKVRDISAGSPSTQWRCAIRQAAASLRSAAVEPRQRADLVLTRPGQRSGSLSRVHVLLFC